ncbi:MAG: glycosyltransferase family 4 protein [Alphaproteobacteria bacterium]
MAEPPVKICQLCAVDFTLHHFLLPLMRGMRAQGHEVVGVCADGPLLAGAREDGFRIETVAIARSYNLLRHIASYRRLKALFRAERFDIVHVHTPVAALIGRFAAWRAKVPCIVYTAHGFYFHERMPWLKRAVFVGLEWLAGRVTDVLFTQSAEDAATARRLKLIRGKTIEAIGNGVDPARFGPAGNKRAKEKIRRETGAGSNAVAIMTVGRLVSEKGYPELFEAMRGVPDAELWVVGERLASDHAGAIDQAIGAVERDPGLAPRVRFLGYRKDVADLLRAADIFVLPSHREGMPRSIIEAMMTGLPVVATDIRGSREEVVEGETGFLVPVGDAGKLAGALGALAGDARLRLWLGTAGRNRAVDLYDEAKVIDRQIDFLELRRAAGSRPSG